MNKTLTKMGRGRLSRTQAQPKHFILETKSNPIFGGEPIL